MVYLVAYQFRNRNTEEKMPFYKALEQFQDFIEVTSSVCLVVSNAKEDDVHNFLEDTMTVGDTLFVSHIFSPDHFYTTDKKINRWLQERVHDRTF